MTTHTKCANNDIVLTLLDDRDPVDAEQHRRDLIEEFWRDAGHLARARYQAAEEDRRREVAVRAAREALLQRATRAATSFGAGAYVPLAQIVRVRGGLELPL